MSGEEYKEFGDISFCHADAYFMHETLTEFCDYDRNNLQLEMIYTDNPDMSASNIYQILKDIVEKAESDDTVLFYFTGHGMKKGEKGYLILPDTVHANLEETALDLHIINEILKAGKGSSFIILDACHSGINARSEMESLYLEEIKDHSCITLASCSEKECSYPDEEKEQGVFTYYLCQEIRNADPLTEINIEQLKINVCDDVAEWCKIHYVQQTPTLLGTSVGNTSFATRNEKKNEYLPAIIIQEEEMIPVSTTDLMVTNNNGEISYSLWQTNTGVSLPKKANLDVLLSYNNQLRNNELKAISVNYNAEIFEIAAEAIWNRAILVLRNRVLGFGTQFVSEMVGVDNLDYINDLPAFETINLAMELGFIDSTGKMRLSHANELVQHYQERGIDEEMPEAECELVIRACMQYILSYEDSEIRIEYIDFREELKTEAFSEARIAMLKESPYFYKKTTVRTLINLLSSTNGAEFETVEANFISIVKEIWNSLISDDKYYIGTAFSKSKNDGNDKLVSAYGQALVQVKGFDYVPENLRSLTFIRAAKQIKKVHSEINNFYNEPAPVRMLNKMGTKIPKPAIKECVGSVLIVLMGNAYGRSFEAVEPAYEILNKLSPADWRYYINNCLVNDEDILYELSMGDSRTANWCSVVEKYKLSELEYENVKVQEFIRHSVEKEYRIVRSMAIQFRKALV